MDVKEIKALIEAVNETDYAYIKIKNKDTVIELSKENTCDCEHPHMPMMMPPMMPTMDQVPPMMSPQMMAQTGAAPKPNQENVVADDPNIYIVESPIVGTYYEASSPDSDPFVKVGDKVTANQTLCIIEAMKLMNEIEAEVNGEVVEIFVNNEDGVEYGQPLFKIRKA